jgi:branched-chain amino acid transport system substrate-binding protein
MDRDEKNVRLRRLSGTPTSRRRFLSRGLAALGLGAISLDLLTACAPSVSRDSGAPAAKPAEPTKPAVAGAPAAPVASPGAGAAASPAASPPAQAAPAQAGAGKDIIIGAPLPLTGAFSEAGQNCLLAVQLAVDDINAAGGIKALGGAKLKVSYGDTSTDNPAQAADVVRRLAGEGASALIGCYLSSLTLPASTAAEQAQVPILSQSFVDTLSSRGYKFYFQLPPKSTAFGNATVDYLLDMTRDSGAQLKSAAMISSDDAASKTQGDTVVANAKGKGIDVPVAEFYPVTIADMSPLVSKVRQSKPQVIFMAGPVPAVILFTKTLRGLGDKTPIVGTGGGGILDVSFPKQLGDAADGVIGLAAWNWDLKQSGIDKIVKAFNEKNNVPFMPQESGESYIMALLLQRAMETAKSSDPKAITTALTGLKLDSGDAIADLWQGRKIEFDPTGVNQTYPLAIQYQGGLPRTVWPKSDQVVKPTFAS